jgi:hypothetical protein
VFQSAGQARKGVLAPLGDGFGIALRWKVKNGEILVAENCFIFFGGADAFISRYKSHKRRILGQFVQLYCYFPLKSILDGFKPRSFCSSGIQLFGGLSLCFQVQNLHIQTLS